MKRPAHNLIQHFTFQNFPVDNPLVETHGPDHRGIPPACNLIRYEARQTMAQPQRQSLRQCRNEAKTRRTVDDLLETDHCTTPGFFVPHVKVGLLAGTIYPNGTIDVIRAIIGKSFHVCSGPPGFHRWQIRESLPASSESAGGDEEIYGADPGIS